MFLNTHTILLLILFNILINMENIMNECFRPFKTYNTLNKFKIREDENIGRYIIENYPNIWLMHYKNLKVITYQDFYFNRYIKPVFNITLFDILPRPWLMPMPNYQKSLKSNGYMSCFSYKYNENCWYNLNMAIVKSFESVIKTCSIGLGNSNFNNILIINRKHRSIKGINILIKNLTLNKYNTNLLNSLYFETNNICEILNMFSKSKFIISTLGSELIYTYFFKNKVIISLNSFTRFDDIFFVKLNSLMGNFQFDLKAQETNYLTCYSRNSNMQSRCNDYILTNEILEMIINILKIKTHENYKYFKDGILIDPICKL